MNVDLSERELEVYRSTQDEPADFDEFWATTLRETRERALDVRIARADVGLSTLEVFDVSFAGFGGTRVSAWLRLPRVRSGPLATVVQFPGYGNGRGHALRDLLWSAAGYAHLFVDVRGTVTSATADPVGSEPGQPGFLTRGIGSPHDYFYRRVLADAVRAVEAVRTLDVVDPTRVIAAGMSQGGGIALAVAGLVHDLAGVIVQAPFLCDMRRASTLTDALPYAEIGQLLAVRRDLTEQVHRTLSYVDGVNHAKRATAPALFSTGLMDPIAPPSTVFGAYHAYAGTKRMNLWPYNGHEAGGTDDDQNALAYAHELLAGTGSTPARHHSPSPRQPNKRLE